MHLLPTPGSPLATGSLTYRFGPAAWRLVVVAKLSYSLEPGQCTLVASATPLVTKERSIDGAASSSIQSPSDMVPFKDRPEFLVIGAAFAPPDHAGSDLTVAIELAGHRKALRVRGRDQAPARPAAGSPPRPPGGRSAGSTLSGAIATRLAWAKALRRRFYRSSAMLARWGLDPFRLAGLRAASGSVPSNQAGRMATSSGVSWTIASSG